MNRMAADGDTVLVLTGSGLKATQALDSLALNVENIGLEELESRLSG
jgi:threonine synthase